MNGSLGDRHLFGAGAAACAVCCAAPLLTLLGLAGAAAAVATFILAGGVFGLVVAAGAGVALWQRRRREREDSCHPEDGPVDIELTTGPGPSPPDTASVPRAASDSGSEATRPRVPSGRGRSTLGTRRLGTRRL